MGRNKSDRHTEAEIGLAVLQVLATRPEGTATVDVLVKGVPNFIELSAADRVPSETRNNEELWEQQVRNLKSHDKTAGNVIGEGFVEHVAKGTYKLTEAGRLHLKHKGLL